MKKGPTCPITRSLRPGMRFIRTRGSDLKGIEELEVYVLFFHSAFGFQPIYLFKEYFNEDRQFVAEPRMVCAL
jgi:hypothetical protein